jgi:hypothetical protein
MMRHLYSRWTDAVEFAGRRHDWLSAAPAFHRQAYDLTSSFSVWQCLLVVQLALCVIYHASWSYATRVRVYVAVQTV